MTEGSSQLKLPLSSEPVKTETPRTSPVHTSSQSLPSVTSATPVLLRHVPKLGILLRPHPLVAECLSEVEETGLIGGEMGLA